MMLRAEDCAAIIPHRGKLLLESVLNCNCSVSKCPSFLRRQESRIGVSEVPACAGTTGLLTLGNPLNSELLL